APARPSTALPTSGGRRRAPVACNDSFGRPRARRRTELRVRVPRLPVAPRQSVWPTWTRRGPVPLVPRRGPLVTTGPTVRVPQGERDAPRGAGHLSESAAASKAVNRKTNRCPLLAITAIRQGRTDQLSSGPQRTVDSLR